jgi:hypothetical protein
MFDIIFIDRLGMIDEQALEHGMPPFRLPPP